MQLCPQISASAHQKVREVCFESVQLFRGLGVAGNWALRHAFRNRSPAHSLRAQFQQMLCCYCVFCLFSANSSHRLRKPRPRASWLGPWPSPGLSLFVLMGSWTLFRSGLFLAGFDSYILQNSCVFCAQVWTWAALVGGCGWAVAGWLAGGWPAEGVGSCNY